MTVMSSMVLSPGVGQGPAAVEAGLLRQFRGGLYQCLPRRADELFELTDALLCAEGPVKTLADLSLAPEHRRAHGALYDGLNCGQVDADRLREELARLSVPRMFGTRIVLALDVSPWLRPDAATCPDRMFCHVYGRGRGRSADQRIPGWPYQMVAALESGPTSWTAILDAVRLGPDDDATAVTAAQLRAVVGRLREAGHWRDGDPAILVVMDSGYDVSQLAFVLADLPVHLVGRLRSDRVMFGPAPPRSTDPAVENLVSTAPSWPWPIGGPGRRRAPRPTHPLIATGRPRSTPSAGCIGG